MPITDSVSWNKVEENFTNSKVHLKAPCAAHGDGVQPLRMGAVR